MFHRIPGVVAFVVAAILPLQLIPVAGVVAAGPAITAIAAEYAHTCALTSTGGVKCWGHNDQGELGNGTTAGSRRPVDVRGLASGVRAISVGGASCALTNVGGVKCWGDNSFGELGNGTTTNSSIPVDVRGLTSGVRSISTGSGHTCAVMSAGGVKCWGYNNHGQLGDGTTTDSNIPIDVAGLTSGVASVSAGYKHTCAVTSTGGVKCWGSNFSGELGDGSSIDSILPVDVTGLTGATLVSAAGISHSCARTGDGSVSCWGSNLLGELGDGTTVDSLIPVSSHVTGATAIAAGDSHTCALTGGGGVKCWGANEAGQLGNGAPSTVGNPDALDVLGLPTAVTAIAAGGSHTCAISSAGGVKCWGSNTYGELGNGTTTTSDVPVDVDFASQAMLTWTARIGSYGVANLRVGSPDRFAFSVKRFRASASYTVTLRRGDCRSLGKLVFAAPVTTTRYGTASRTFTLSSAQKGLASLPLAIRFGSKCAPFAAPMPLPSPTPTPTPTPRATPAPLPWITLAAPASGATIAQDNPAAPGCSAHATRGYGFTVDFGWNAPPMDGISEYRLVVQHVGGFNAALDVRVSTPSSTWTSCNSFVVDSNLSGWYWQVTALTIDKQVIAVSEQRAISFTPCRLADGVTACSAP